MKLMIHEFFPDTVCKNPYKNSLINIKKILNISITKFYNGDHVNMLWLTKRRPTSFYKKHKIF